MMLVRAAQWLLKFARAFVVTGAAVRCWRCCDCSTIEFVAIVQLNSGPWIGFGMEIERTRTLRVVRVHFDHSLARRSHSRTRISASCSFL